MLTSQPSPLRTPGVHQHECGPSVSPPPPKKNHFISTQLAGQPAPLTARPAFRLPGTVRPRPHPGAKRAHCTVPAQCVSPRMSCRLSCHMHAIAPVTCTAGAFACYGSKYLERRAPRTCCIGRHPRRHGGRASREPAPRPRLLGVLATRVAWFPLLLSRREVLAREHLDRLAHPSPTEDAQGSSDGRVCAACSVLYLLFGVHLREIFRRQARQAEAPFCSGVPGPWFVDRASKNKSEQVNTTTRPSRW